MFSSYYAQHSHNLLPQCSTFLCVHQGSDAKEYKKTQSFYFSTSNFFCPSPLLFLYLPLFHAYFCYPCLLATIPLPFLSLTTRSCPKALPFTLSWFSPFFLFIIFHSTNKHLELTYFLHINPTSRWKWFKVELTLKEVKSPFPTLIPNDCLLLYIQPIPQNCLLCTPHNFSMSKCQGSNPLTIQNYVLFFPT